MTNKKKSTKILTAVKLQATKDKKKKKKLKAMREYERNMREKE